MPLVLVVRQTADELSLASSRLDRLDSPSSLNNEWIRSRQSVATTYATARPSSGSVHRFLPSFLPSIHHSCYHHCPAHAIVAAGYRKIRVLRAIYFSYLSSNMVGPSMTLAVPDVPLLRLLLLDEDKDGDRERSNRGDAPDRPALRPPSLVVTDSPVCSSPFTNQEKETTKGLVVVNPPQGQLGSSALLPSICRADFGSTPVWSKAASQDGKKDSCRSSGESRKQDSSDRTTERGNHRVNNDFGNHQATHKANNDNNNNNNLGNNAAELHCTSTTTVVTLFSTTFEPFGESVFSEEKDSEETRSLSFALLEDVTAQTRSLIAPELLVRASKKKKWQWLWLRRRSTTMSSKNSNNNSSSRGLGSFRKRLSGRMLNTKGGRGPEEDIPTVNGESSSQPRARSSSPAPDERRTGPSSPPGSPRRRAGTVNSSSVMDPTKSPGGRRLNNNSSSLSRRSHSVPPEAEVETEPRGSAAGSSSTSGSGGGDSQAAASPPKRGRGGGGGGEQRPNVFQRLRERSRSRSRSRSRRSADERKEMLVAVTSCRSDGYYNQKAPGSTSKLPRKAPTNLKLFHELAVGVKDAYAAVGATPRKPSEVDAKNMSKQENEGNMVLWDFIGNLDFVSYLHCDSVCMTRYA